MHDKAERPSDPVPGTAPSDMQHTSSGSGLKGLFGFLNRVRTEEADSDSLPADEDPDPAGAGATAATAPGDVPVVGDVMVTRADIIAVASSASLDELVNVYKTSGRTRIPVYDDTLDNPLGFVHLKDIALEYGFNGKTHASFDMARWLRKPLYVPPSMEIASLRETMQAEACHMALVIDEYGGVDGLVTIEDLLEHHFGKILDEHDRPTDGQHRLREIKPGTYECSGQTLLETIEAAYERPLFATNEDEEIDTIGGWISDAFNRIPEIGDNLLIDSDRIKVTVVKADARKVNILRFSPHTQT